MNHNDAIKKYQRRIFLIFPNVGNSIEVKI